MRIVFLVLLLSACEPYRADYARASECQTRLDMARTHLDSLNVYYSTPYQSHSNCAYNLGYVKELPK